MDRTISDMYYLQLPTGGPTQADIWSGLPTGTAESDTCTGVIITPRCDFAHEKSPVINYLPLVDYEKYLLSVACFALLEGQINDAKSALLLKAEAAGLGALVELGVPPCELEKHIALEAESAAKTSNKQKDKPMQDFRSGLQKLESLKNLVGRPQLNIGDVKQGIGSKAFLKLQRDIIKNNTPDSYFLPPCDDILPQPAVIALRQIYTCPITTVGGFHPRAAACADGAGSPQRLLRIKSPFAESLMAKFAALFTRVGTRDLPDQAVTAFLLPAKEVADRC